MHFIALIGISTEILYKEISLFLSFLAYPMGLVT